MNQGVKLYRGCIRCMDIVSVFFDLRKSMHIQVMAINNLITTNSSILKSIISITEQKPIINPFIPLSY